MLDLEKLPLPGILIVSLVDLFHLRDQCFMRRYLLLEEIDQASFRSILVRLVLTWLFSCRLKLVMGEAISRRVPLLMPKIQPVPVA